MTTTTTTRWTCGRCGASCGADEGMADDGHPDHCDACWAFLNGCAALDPAEPGRRVMRELTRQSAGAAAERADAPPPGDTRLYPGLADDLRERIDRVVTGPDACHVCRGRVRYHLPASARCRACGGSGRRRFGR